MDHLSIGRFTAHRPSKSADHIPRMATSPRDDVFRPDSAPKKPTRYSLSWLTPARRRTQSPPVLVRSGQDLHRISNPLPPVLAAPQISVDLSTSASQCDAASTISNSHHQELAPQSVESGSIPHLRRRRGSPGLRGKFSKQNHWFEQGLFGDLLLSNNLFSNKMSDLVDRRGRPTAPVSQSKEDEQYSSNVEQLMQEAERAFDAVGDAINDVSLSWPANSVPSVPAPNPVEPTSHSKSVPVTVSPKQEQTKKTGIFERRQPVRKASVAKSPRKLRGRKVGPDGPPGARSQAMTIPWSIAESFGNALGQRFKRVEVDEMLTPDRMEELKRSREEAREAEERSRSSSESKRSTSSYQTTRSDPLFSIEDVASITEPEEATEADKMTTAPEDQLLMCPEPLVDDTSASEDDEPQMTSPVTIGTFTFPTPPLKLNPRHAARSAQSARLSTIPEGPASARNSRAKADRDSWGRPQHGLLDDKDDVVFLKGTPLSSANRAFRHGPIPCQKPELGRIGGPIEEMDKSVDWLAFQMAILGGAGDLVSGMYEDDQNQLAEDVAEWFETFGFESHGQLIPANAKPVQDPTCGSLSSSPPAGNSDTELPIPVSSEGPSAHGWGAYGGSADLNTVKFFQKTGRSDLRRYRATNGQVRRPSLAYDQPTSAAVPEPRMAETAPMACNLERDLGDFLRWESQFVNGVY